MAVGLHRLAATLSAVGNAPVAGLAIILGIDPVQVPRSACSTKPRRQWGLATIVVAKWCATRSTRTSCKRRSTRKRYLEADQPEVVLDAKNAHIASLSLPQAIAHEARIDRSGPSFRCQGPEVSATAALARPFAPQGPPPPPVSEVDGRAASAARSLPGLGGVDDGRSRPPAWAGSPAFAAQRARYGRPCAIRRRTSSRGAPLRLPPGARRRGGDSRSVGGWSARAPRHGAPWHPPASAWLADQAADRRRSHRDLLNGRHARCRARQARPLVTGAERDGHSGGAARARGRCGGHSSRGRSAGRRVHDMRHALDIDAGGGNVGGHQQARAAGLEVPPARSRAFWLVAGGIAAGSRLPRRRTTRSAPCLVRRENTSARAIDGSSASRRCSRSCLRWVSTKMTCCSTGHAWPLWRQAVTATRTGSRSSAPWPARQSPSARAAEKNRSRAWPAISLTSLRMAWMEPMSSIPVGLVEDDVPRPCGRCRTARCSIRSISRPGVATRTSTPRCISWICRFIDTPPKITAQRKPAFLPTRKLSAIWPASSRVGLRTSTRQPLAGAGRLSRAMRWRIGSANAAVLPVPSGRCPEGRGLRSRAGWPAPGSEWGSCNPRRQAPSELAR